MMIHSNARPVISTLSIPSPIKKYFSHRDWDIDLSNNTNPYGGDLAEYPDVCQNHLKEIYLSTVLSLKPSPQTKPKLTPENVLFTVGSMEGLDLLMRTLSEPNKDVICIPTPTFSAYEHWAVLHNLTVRHIPLQGKELNHLPIKEILDVNPKMVFLCDPNNPVGTKLDASVVPQLCELFDGFVVVDEAYIEFADHPSSLYYLNKYKNLIILRTFSKAWGMAGVRCGGILADKLIINALRYVQLPFGLSSLAQEIVRNSLLSPDATFSSWHRIKKNRENLIANLLKLQVVKKIYKSEANFIMPVFNDFEKVIELLRINRIHVLNCSATLPNAMRVSIGNEQQNRKFLEVIGEASLSRPRMPDRDEVIHVECFT